MATKVDALEERLVGEVREISSHWSWGALMFIMRIKWRRPGRYQVNWGALTEDGTGGGGKKDGDPRRCGLSRGSISQIHDHDHPGGGTRIFGGTIKLGRESFKLAKRNYSYYQVEQLEQEVSELRQALKDKQEQEQAMLQVLIRVEQEQKVTEDARMFAEQDAAAQKYASHMLQVLFHARNLQRLYLYVASFIVLLVKKQMPAELCNALPIRHIPVLVKFKWRWLAAADDSRGWPAVAKVGRGRQWPGFSDGDGGGGACGANGGFSDGFHEFQLTPTIWEKVNGDARNLHVLLKARKKYEEAMAMIAQMEKRAVMAETMLAATLQGQSSPTKAQGPSSPSPRASLDNSNATSNQDTQQESPSRKISLLSRPFGLAGVIETSRTIIELSEEKKKKKRPERPDVVDATSVPFYRLRRTQEDGVEQAFPKTGRRRRSPCEQYLADIVELCQRTPDETLPMDAAERNFTKDRSYRRRP
ncbi:hypothetical protein KFK09_015090 [Dendrobium nobile]|uniref:Uncharacterized protein n=1 Tax=Dendrobium nobile TaxID=94219 RepID=A0A8T3B4Z5_DENNO|nr:hypothetical protein KFK09_015090 [Dendrobium nobile]